MKKQVRMGVFETNSSSTHTLCICTEQQFKAWEDGKLLYNRYNDKFIENREMTEEEKEEAVKDYWTRYQKNHKYVKDYEELTSEEKAEVYKDVEEGGYFDVDEDYETCNEWYDDEYLEFYEEHYTTEHGDKIVVFGKYGYDG